jgi:hypothetical protein
MREKYFYRISWAVIIMLWFTFIVFPLVDSSNITGFTVMADQELGPFSLFSVFILFILGLVFAIFLKIPSLEDKKISSFFELLNNKSEKIDNKYNDYYLKELELFIKDASEKGYSAIEIKNSLISSGWPEEKIDQLLPYSLNNNYLFSNHFIHKEEGSILNNQYAFQNINRLNNNQLNNSYYNQNNIKNIKYPNSYYNSKGYIYSNNNLYNQTIPNNNLYNSSQPKGNNYKNMNSNINNKFKNNDNSNGSKKKRVYTGFEHL